MRPAAGGLGIDRSHAVGRDGAGLDDAAASSRPVVQAGVTERFVRAGAGQGAVVYQPRIGAKVRAHFVDTKAGMNAWEESYYLAPLDKDAPDWSQAEVLAEPGPEWDDEPRGDAAFRATCRPQRCRRAITAPGAAPSRTTSTATRR